MSTEPLTTPAFLADALTTRVGRVLVSVTPEGWKIRVRGVVLASGTELKSFLVLLPT